ILLILAGCGFQLRGLVKLPYHSLYLSLPQNSEIAALLRRQLSANGITLVDVPSSADAQLHQLYDSREKLILTINTQGRVRENQLRLRYGFRMLDAQGREVVPPQDITLTRDITYNDSAVLAKEQEELLLWREMQKDAVQQILRRLAALTPQLTAEERD
ncbi:MAG: hypothetical protein RIR00_2203, partial [Pseudomonadota bacterium]